MANLYPIKFIHFDQSDALKAAESGLIPIKINTSSLAAYYGVGVQNVYEPATGTISRVGYSYNDHAGARVADSYIQEVWDGAGNSTGLVTFFHRVYVEDGDFAIAINSGGTTSFNAFFISGSGRSVGINKVPDNSAVLDLGLNLTSGAPYKGFKPPSMNTTNKESIVDPVAGLMVYDIDTNKMQCFNGTQWLPLMYEGGALDFVATGQNPAQSGQLRLSNDETITVRNGTNTADALLARLRTNNVLDVGDGTHIIRTRYYTNGPVDFYRGTSARVMRLDTSIFFDVDVDLQGTQSLLDVYNISFSGVQDQGVLTTGTKIIALDSGQLHKLSVEGSGTINLTATKTGGYHLILTQGNGGGHLPVWQGNSSAANVLAPDGKINMATAVTSVTVVSILFREGLFEISTGKNLIASAVSVDE